jgi:V/A-type H+/Na+-transporting ATPase subunit K
MMWVAFAAAAAIAVTALATGYAQSRIGASIAASLAEKPELRTTAVLMIAIPETMVVLGFVIAVLLLMRGG